MAKTKARWLASLSDGSIAIEGKPPFEEISGQQSPWLRLQRYVSENRLDITGLRIQVEKDGEPIKTFNLPSKSPKAKFSFLKPLIPKYFNYFRRVEASMSADKEFLKKGELVLAPDDAEFHWIEIHAVYDDFELVTIVDEDTGNECWNLIITK